MSTQTVVWSAIPNGFTGDPTNRRARLSVYISMRLRSDQGQSLSLFPEIASWPARLAAGKVTFTVQVGTTAVPARITSKPPEAALWAALFPPASLVVAHQPDDLTMRPVVSYPAASVLGHLRRGYQQVTGADPYELPPRGSVHHAVQAAFVSPDPVSAGRPGPAGDLEADAVNLAENLFRGGTSLDDTVARAHALARQRARAAKPGTFVEVVPNTGTPASHLAQLYVFHDRSHQTQVPRSAARATAPPAQPPIDFHQALAALGQYPELLRRLGLVIDLDVPVTSIPAAPLVSSGGQETRLQVIPSFSPSASFTSYSPQTAYIRVGDQLFTPQPKTPSQPELIGGFVNLPLPDQHALIQLDVDGSGLKSANMAADQTGESAGGVPSLRTSGIWIARAGQAALLAGPGGRFATALGNNTQLAADLAAMAATGAPPDQPVILYAEDVTRGYRVDVLDSDQAPVAWRSLHARTAACTFKAHAGGALVLTIADEGMTQPSAAEAVPGDPAAALYIHESLFHWQGWSLSAPRPGKTVGDIGPESVANTALPDGFQLEVAASVTPGTLPRLRFGHRYQFRLRTVDLAGNSLSLAEADQMLRLLPTMQQPVPVLPAKATDFVYRRFEPVVSPVLVATEQPTEGESLQRLVIRSNGQETAAACATRLTVLIAARRPQDRVLYTVANERHVAPPKTSEWTAEASGMLEAAFGVGKPPSTSTPLYHIARKEKGSLNDTSIVDTATGQAVPLPSTLGIDPITGATLTRPAVEIVADNRTHATLHHEPQLRLPYLPDPLSAGAALSGLPGVPAGQSGTLDAQGQLHFTGSTLPAPVLSSIRSLTHVDFGAQWPERLPFHLRLTEPTDPHAQAALPSWDPKARLLTVYLAKGDQAVVRLSSFLGQTLDLLGAWRWMLESAATQGVAPPDATSAQAGVVWALTPFREMVLVHAVQQPLVAPQLQTVTTLREPGSTFAYFGATVPVHGKSTAKLDLLASWQEVNDSPDSGRTTRGAAAHIFDVPIHLPDEIDGSTAPPDTVPVAVYDAAKDTVTFVAVVPPMPPPKVHPPGRPPGPRPLPNGNGGNGDDTSEPPRLLSRHEFGDTRYRQVTYQAVATTRFRDYFPQEVANDPTQISLAGPQAPPVDVLSTARPAAPTFVSALPLFEWSRTMTPAGTQVRVRKGGGIRVYVDRPWFSSGDGELLGVVLVDPAAYPPSDALRPYVTHWGSDPIWRTDPVADAPLPASFTSFGQPAIVGRSLSLDGLATPVHVAGCGVAYDKNRRLWYADIHVEVGASYWPFVRLALARYQPHSLSGLELSKVVLADVVQLAPNRTVTLTPSGPDHVALQVEGITYLSGSWNPGEFGSSRTIIDVSVQERIPGSTDDLGWRPVNDPAAKVQIDSARHIPDSPASPGPLLWSGQVSLPPDRQPGRVRILVKEFERLTDDSRLHKRIPVDPGEVRGRKGDFQNVTWAPGGDRMVFVETILL